MASFTREDYRKAADLIRSRTKYQPTVGVILGSGLGGLADAIENADVLPTHEIPGWPPSTVQGHAGKLVIGTLEGRTVLTLQGRIHFYEGYTMQQVTFPVRVMQALGIKTLIVTNACGGINTSYHQGDIMLISDHISLVAMAGLSPLAGPNDESLGERFVDMTTAYDAKLRQIAHSVAKQAGFTLQEGVYFNLSGPTFETPAEIRFLRAVGADTVGMSTAPEVIVARHAQMRVLGFSVVTNMAVDTPGRDQTGLHAEVLDVGKQVAPRLIALMRGVLGQLGS